MCRKLMPATFPGGVSRVAPGSVPYFGVTYLTRTCSIFPLNLNGAFSE
jgi:hypothetical protein